MRSIRQTCFTVGLLCGPVAVVWVDHLADLVVGVLFGVALWCIVVMVWIDLHLLRVERELRELESGIKLNGRDRAESSPGRCGE